MTERRIVIDHLKLSYEGVVNIKDLYHLMDDWLVQKNFNKRERLNQEIVRHNGKYIHLVLEPWKKISDYAQHLIKIDIKLLDVKNVKVKVDGKKRTVQQARVRFIFDGYLDTDYEGKWETNPIFFLVRSFMDKFIYRQYSEENTALLIEHVTQLHHMIRAFLNMHRHDFGIVERPETWEV